LASFSDLDTSRLTVLPSEVDGEGKDGDSYPFRLCPSEVEILFGITVVGTLPLFSVWFGFSFF
jgi:hypothetical protein